MPSLFRRLSCPLALFATVVLLPACGGRTGLRLPDLRPFRAPVCSSDTATVRVSTRPDPLVPTHLAVLKVQYNIVRKCSRPAQEDPQQPGPDDIDVGCTVVLYARGGQEVGGDCIGPSSSPGSAPAGWHTGTVGTDPRNLFVDMFGETQGNFCVYGWVTFTNGAVAELPMRAWRVMSGAGRSIPEVGYWTTRDNDTGQDPIVNPFSSMPGCPP